MDTVSSGYRANGGSDRRSSAGYDGMYNNRQQQPSATPTTTTSMGPPSSTSRGQGGYTSMTGAGHALQDVDHPPSKSATGGQSHAHRPVSAMPTPTSRGHYSSSRQAEPSVLSDINNTAYNERRASAHPTMSTSSHQSSSMASPLSFSPNNLDAATSNAIGSGIPVTSPAALQYFAAHPRRQQVHFGNYLLLQTLGEGEFGKVKLGVHKEWGEEVAVKLIKRDKVGTPDGHLQITGPSKDPSKMSKVEKEIRVLKVRAVWRARWTHETHTYLLLPQDVRHPNIVRLYEVIESDRYIGIVLEYASGACAEGKQRSAEGTDVGVAHSLTGGELFDHILAHKYLKERDACRLFAQLISGVSYLHHKKIVHRDLKLENLLLDRNRNVIITDFGFANNFENRKDDLMATSCGSPCYAAPELVVQDGLYAGSAVDVWSCGVILYAMLAGYLPYDDDPKNPEGDNINLLYKYIMATPLSFPDYISAEPRDLLCKMLVPDPMKRADLETVMSHHWLAPYRDLFRFSVDDLERAAIEQQNKKRMVYRQQMMMQQQLADQQAGKGSNRSSALGAEGASIKQQRHQSAVATSSTMPNRVGDVGQATANSRSRPVTGLPTPITTVDVPAPLERIVDSPARGSAAPSSQASAGSRKSAGQKTQRHTIQLEYDAQSSADRRREAGETGRMGSSSSTFEAIPPVPRVPRQGEEALSSPKGSEYNTPSRETMAATAASAYIPTVPVVVPSAERKASAGTRSSGKGSTGSAASQRERDERSGLVARKSTSSRIASNPLPSNASPEAMPTTTKDRVASGGAGPHPEARKSVGGAQLRPSTASTTLPISPSEQAAGDKTANRHRKGMSTDKFFFSRILGTPSEASSSPGRVPSAARSDLDQSPATSEAVPGRKTSGSRRKAMSLVVGRYGDQSTPTSKEKAASKVAKEERRMTGRVRKDTLPSSASAKYETPKKPSAVAAQGESPSSASVLTTSGSIRQTSGSKAGSQAPFDQRLNESNSTVGPSSNAAKKVMDWFRKKSLSRGAFDEKPPLGPFEADQHHRGTSNANHAVETPRLVVTNDGGREEERVETLAGEGNGLDSVPSSRSTSGTHSQTSQATDGTGVTTVTEASSTANGHKSSASTVQQQATPRASTMMAPSAKFNDGALRVHQGAVDQSALTSRPPNEVFDQVRLALFHMGIEAKQEREEEFKMECIRRKRAKTLMGATQGLGLSIRTSVFPPSQADYERSSAARGNTAASPSVLSTSPSTAGSLRNLLRRGSNQQNTLASTGDEAVPPPIYGEASVDGGQEVRFSVEITKIKNLPGLYSLDIRRMKGNLWAYKFLYHALLDRCHLGGMA